MAFFKRACIFIDGENLRHSLLDLFQPQFRREDYLPNADWGQFFDQLVERAGAEERIRAYWYVVQYIDFRPWKLPNDQPTLIGILCKHKPYAEEFAKLQQQERALRAREIKERLQNYRQRMLDRFRGWTAIQDGITSRVDAVEFRRAGSISYDLFTGDLGTEKAVDVKLATDLLELRPIYDLAIIVSGDQDYVPAVQAIKDSGKRVINACFLQTDGTLLPGGARRLNQVTDEVLEFPYQDLRNLMGFA